jgi:DNA (cytosine-5)-methyltransferase 1
VLCGGFPCQDISVAGKGAGLAGTRSGLWSEYARLVGELRPRYVVVENVPALRKRGLETVLADLLALGYDAEWDGISASAVGAPHRRDRIWIVAYPQCGELRIQSRRGSRPDGQGQALPGVDGSSRHMADADSPRPQRYGAERELGQAGAEVSTGGGGSGARAVGLADSTGGGLRTWLSHIPEGQSDPAGCSSESLADPFSGGRNRGSWQISEAHRRRQLADGSFGGFAEWWAVEPDVGRVAHGVPARVDRLRALGNALIPQIAQFLGERILERETALASS